MQHDLCNSVLIAICEKKRERITDDGRIKMLTFTVMSLHSNNNYAKKRGIGKKLLLTIRAIMQEEHVGLVAGDFNGAAWRQSNSNNPQRTSIIEEAFCRHRLSDAAWLHTVVGPRCSARRMDRCVWQSLEKPSAFVKEIRVATTKYSYIWTLSAIDMPQGKVLLLPAYQRKW